ncbi:MAG: GNAT family N-acetyltransferase [Chloroflexi bacterium]|nr:GNAT family N-acetyltransferase [Chloroflexota bacterium]
MTPQIRIFTSNDRLGLIPTIDFVCGEGRWMSTTRFEPTPSWTHALEEPHCPCHLLLVVEDAGCVVGWCRTFPKDGWSETQEATLGLGLLPAYRNRGIGTALIRQSLSWARDAGYWRVSLTTYPNNARAIHVFSSCGFAFTQRTERQLLEMACGLLSGALGMQGESHREN